MEGVTPPYRSYIFALSLIIKVFHLVCTSSRTVVATDYSALSQVNSSTLVFYKNIANNLEVLAKATKEIENRSEKVAISAKDVESVWNRTLQLEAIVNSLDAYSARLEAQLRPSSASSG